MQIQSPMMEPQSVFAIDSRRRNFYQPGELVTSVRMDQNGLECLYCVRFFPFCCCKASNAHATYMDIYANNVVAGLPFYCCCSCNEPKTSMGAASHYDDPTVHHDTVVKGECCSPFPFCLVDCFGCCGEVLVFRGACCSGARPFAMGNQASTCTYCPIISCCFPISVMYGLAPGEAMRAAAVINTQVANFRNSQWAHEPKVAIAMGTGRQQAGTQVVINNVVGAQPAYAAPPQPYPQQPYPQQCPPHQQYAPAPAPMLTDDEPANYKQV